MITQRQAEEYLRPGDEVFTVKPGALLRTKALQVGRGRLHTTAGILEFEDHGFTWFLTERAARENMS